MDADILRLILFLSGIGLILGIYFWDRHKRVNVMVHAIKRAQKEEPVIDSKLELADDKELELADDEALEWREEPTLSIPEELDQPVEPDQDLPPDELLESPARVDEEDLPELAAIKAEAEADEAVDQVLAQLDAMVHEENDDAREVEQSQFSFTTEAPEDTSSGIGGADVPLKILQLNVVAHRGGFSGEDVVKAAADLQMYYGDMSIYHRYDGDPARGRVLFGMASLVEPGTFPPAGSKGFLTPGVTLFAQLPGYQESMAIFSDMLFTAERLAVMLDGSLQDGNHSDLSKQTISHIREGILEHQRQVKLARRRR